MNECRLLIANEVLVYLESLKKRDRLSLRNRFVQIAMHPGDFAGFRERDVVDRILDVNVLGCFAITYWWDFADRDVKILKVGIADR